MLLRFSIISLVSLLSGGALTSVAFSAEQTSAATLPAQANAESPRYGWITGPDGWYVTQSSTPFGQAGMERILRLDFDGGQSASPPWADTRYSESDAYFSPDGARVCFVSNRPAPAVPANGASTTAASADIWCAELSDTGWTPARHLPEPVNSPATEYSPVLTSDGAIWFASDRPGGHGMGDLYRAMPQADGSWQVDNLGPTINSPYGEWNLELSPNGDMLLIEASHRAENRSVPGDLWLSRRADNSWSAPVPLSRLNTRGSELMARFQSGSEVVYGSGSGTEFQLKQASLQDFEPLPPTLAALSRSAHQLVLLDPQTLAVRQRFNVGTGPHEIASSADGRFAVVPSHGTHPRPHEQPIQPQELRWQAGISDGLSVLDLVSGEQTLLTLENCPQAHGAATTAQGERMWITCEGDGSLREINPQTAEQVARIELAPGVHKVMYLPASKLLVASNPDRGEVSLVRLESGEVITTVTGKGAEALAATADESALWVANGFEPSVCRIETKSGRNTGCWPSGGSFPIALAVDEARGLVWIARSGSSDLAALSLDGHQISREIPLPSPPLGMALDAVHGRLYLTLPRLNEVIMLDIDSGEIIRRQTGIMEADDLDLIPAAAFASPPDT